MLPVPLQHRAVTASTIYLLVPVAKNPPYTSFFCPERTPLEHQPFPDTRNKAAGFFFFFNPPFSPPFMQMKTSKRKDKKPSPAKAAPHPHTLQHPVLTAPSWEMSQDSPTISCRTLRQAERSVRQNRAVLEGLCSWEIMELFSQLGPRAFFYPPSVARLFPSSVLSGKCSAFPRARTHTISASIR